MRATLAMTCLRWLPVFALAALPAASTAVPPVDSTYKTTGTVIQSCKFDSKTTFRVTIVITGNGTSRSGTIAVDGSSATALGNTGQSRSATQTYTSFKCNSTGNLTLSAPVAINGTASYNYTVDVKKNGTSQVSITNNSPASKVFAPGASTGATGWSIVASANGPANGITTGSYIADITIQ